MSTLRLFASGNALAFSRADLRFALLWGILPNAIFVPLSLFAAPMRTPAILAYFLIGLLAARFGAIVAAAGLASAVAFDVLWVISGAYNLSIAMVVESVSFAWRLNFYGSPIFLALAVGLAAQFGAILWLRERWRSDLAVARPYAGLLLVTVIALGDAMVNLPPTQSLIGPAHGNAPVESATGLSGFAERALAEPGDALFVIVEGYGVISDASLRGAVEAAFSDSKLRQRYDVRVGEAPFRGSTTAAEMRELCGMRDEYTQLASSAADMACLPGRLAGAGYDTLGLHAFTGDFFDRHVWWPRMGLHESLFAEQLLRTADRRWRHCGAVFTGLCDSDLADFIQARLSAPNEKPQFVYWLTLNTHIPLMPEPDSSAFGCGTSADPFGDAQTCAMADIWAETFRSVADIAMAEKSDLQILLVGDHAPPSWTRRGRNLFEPGIVRWISLTPKPS